MNEATTVYRVSPGTASRPKKLSAKYQFHKGVFKTQREYIVKYKLDEGTQKELLTEGYFSLYPLALRCKDNDFINEIEQYMSSQQIVIKDIKKYVNRHNQIQVVIDWVKKNRFAYFIKRFYKKYFKFFK